MDEELNMNKEHCLDLSQQLRAMLEDKLGEGTNLKRNTDARPIVHLFGITYADDLDGLEEFDMMFIASKAGLAARTYGPLIEEGRNLSQYVNVREVNQFEDEVRIFMQEVRRRLPEAN